MSIGESYLLIKVKIKEVIACDVLPVAMLIFVTMTRSDERPNMLACPHHDLHECNCAQLVNSPCHIFRRASISRTYPVE